MNSFWRRNSKLPPWAIKTQYCLQIRCPFCQPTKCVKASKALLPKLKDKHCSEKNGLWAKWPSKGAATFDNFPLRVSLACLDDVIATRMNLKAVRLVTTRWHFTDLHVLQWYYSLWLFILHTLVTENAIFRRYKHDVSN